MLIGSHIHMKKPDFLLGAVNEAHQYGENTLMVYTGSPHNTERVPIEEMKIEIGEMTLVIQNGLTVKEVADSIHPHPTISDSIVDCADDALHLPINN